MGEKEAIPNSRLYLIIFLLLLYGGVTTYYLFKPIAPPDTTILEQENKNKQRVILRQDSIISALNDRIAASEQRETEAREDVVNNKTELKKQNEASKTITDNALIDSVHSILSGIE